VEFEGNFLNAFLLTLGAGLATGVGAVIAFFADRRSPWLLSFGLGFSAGVMIYVSFMEILPQSLESISQSTEGFTANLIRLAAFAGGLLFTAVIDRLVPDTVNPHEIRTEHDIDILHKKNADKNDINEKLVLKNDPNLARAGIFTAFAIALHNFPEGFATFTAALSDPVLGVTIAAAIALHNIPEGIAISVPIFYATGKRIKAFMYALLSGLAEPVGALIGWLILRQFMNDMTFGIVFAGVAGIMIYISIDELLPAARKYGKEHVAISGVIAGMIIMAVGLDIMDNFF